MPHKTEDEDENDDEDEAICQPSSSDFNHTRKAAVNAPQSKRFAMFVDSWRSRERLDCGGFSTALLHLRQC